MLLSMKRDGQLSRVEILRSLERLTWLAVLPQPFILYGGSTDRGSWSGERKEVKEVASYARAIAPSILNR